MHDSTDDRRTPGEPRPAAAGESASREPGDPPRLVEAGSSAPAEPPRPPEYKAPSGVWHGITWQDVPGHDEHTQKLNFSLLRRGMLKGHQDCRNLEGEELKAKLQKLSERNRKNSRKGRRRGVTQPPRFPLPPPRFPAPPPRYPYPS